ncbi:MAG: ATP-binding cassette domain-containing protein [Firmicutes bacterium]|jgi:cell division transport system ATP-binding protein|nr:ATP-binding cassette domain-containing protein [Bacillota bacterium]
MPEIRLEGVAKYYKVETRKHMAVRDIDLKIQQGEFVFLIGSSGAGKSTILKLLGGMIPPDEGTAYLDNISMSRFFGPWQYRLRRTFGCVWQEPWLIRKSTVYENLFLTARSGGMKNKHINAAIAKSLGLVGIQEMAKRYPAELSKGECRRVELARALICSPSVLLLDELTADWDDDNIWDAMHLLDELNRRGTTIVMSTHASKYVNIMRRRVVTLVDGKIAGDVPNGRYGDISRGGRNGTGGFLRR